MIEALNKVIDDLNVKLERAHAEFDRRTAEHEAEVRRLNELIFSAESDIASTEAYLRDVLYVMKATLE